MSDQFNSSDKKKKHLPKCIIVMRYTSQICSIAVLLDGTIILEVFGILGFALVTCAVHLPHAGDLVH